MNYEDYEDERPEESRPQHRTFERPRAMGQRQFQLSSKPPVLVKHIGSDQLNPAININPLNHVINLNTSIKRSPPIFQKENKFIFRKPSRLNQVHADLAKMRAESDAPAISNQSAKIKQGE